MAYTRDPALLRVASLLLFFVFASTCLAQTGEPAPGTVVIGKCSGHEKDPGCVIPNLFGPAGLTVTTTYPHYAHFIGSAQTTLNQTLSTAIATQLAILPFISPASGFTFKYDPATGGEVRTTESFGPIYTERAETVGRGKVYLGVSYQPFRFSSLDGISLKNIPAVFTHVGGGPGDQVAPIRKDLIYTNSSIDLKMDQTMLFGTVGITDRVDFSIAIPIVDTRIRADSFASIVRVSGPTFTPVGGTLQPNPHQFEGGALTKSYTSSGSATGLGDVTFRMKGNLLNTDKLRLSLLLDVRAPTGDARKLLGTGAIGLKPFVAISVGKRLAPHLNVGYEWNGKSVLAGDVTGVQDPKQHGLPDVFFYSAGTDYGVTNRLTLAVDYLGQMLINAPRVFQVTGFFPPGPAAGIVNPVFPTITPGKDTVGFNSGAAGLKYRLFGGLLLTADVLFRLDNKGLWQGVTPLVALSYAFGSR